MLVWCLGDGGVVRGRRGREKFHRRGFAGVCTGQEARGPLVSFSPPVDRWVPPLSCLHPAVLPVPSFPACLTGTSGVFSRQVKPVANPLQSQRFDLGQLAKLRNSACYPRHLIGPRLTLGPGVVHVLVAYQQSEPQSKGDIA